ncbi:MAG: DEAD/DEAH box helicase [Leptospiraceae bacterium]|nr:DEAD/DEAH box helicase [Leptospiraceae bacterium]
MSQGLLPFTNPLDAQRTRSQADSIDFRFFHESWQQADCELANTVLEACQIKISHLYAKLGCLSNSRTRLLPHQIEATHRVVSSLRPRFLIADEVGLGKTIEAGLIIKELMLRKGMQRVLVVVPAPLSVQWQQEMQSKFNEDFVILNRQNFRQICSSWSRHKKLITSIDFIKNPVYADEVLRLQWDIAVFDEAHRLRRDYSKVTKAWSFADQMARNSDAFLLLSATPFRGKLEELYFLIQLLDPHLLGPYQNFVQEFVIGSAREGSTALANLRAKIQRVMLRRRKVDVGGFTKRHARTIRFELSPPERLLYDETTDYVKREYNLAMQQENRAVSFIMIVFQKLLDSSSPALLGALERRKAMLEKRMYAWSQMGSETENDLELDLDDLLDESDSPDSLFDTLSDHSSRPLRDIRREIMTIGRLIQIARSIEQDRKLAKLVETLSRLEKKGSTKFIIFTQFRTTQEYLARQLRERYHVTLFHGSLNWKEKEAAIEEFRDHSQVLILTEAGGEGRNLQFTNILINYDLPWSPVKIEQRIGRVHRFGQSKDVYIFNFVTSDTVAERILEVLERKIHLFSETIGTPDVLLGQLEDENRFQKNFMKFISGQKSKAELEAEIEAQQRIATTGYARLNDLVTPHCVDFNLDDYYSFSTNERHVDNLRLESIVLRYLQSKIEADWHLERAPAAIITEPRFSAEAAGQADYLLRKGADTIARPATFNSDKALENPRWDFLALGHPLVEEALRFYLEHSARHQILHCRQVGAFRQGWYFVFLATFKNGMQRSELFSCHLNDKEECQILENELLACQALNHAPRTEILADSREMEHCLQIAVRTLQPWARKRANELRDQLHTVFKKEEYKLEISYGKKIRNLEEKRGRQQMRLRLNPGSTNQAALSRTENEIQRAEQELQQKLYALRQKNIPDVELQLLQICRIIGS